MDWYIRVLRHYVDFSGRATRAEYWWFVLFNFLAGVVLEIFVAVFRPLVFLTTVYALAVLLPGLAVEVRRLHDSNRSAWNLLWGLVPLVGWIILLVFLIRPGTLGPNQYGLEPVLNPRDER